VQRFLGDILLPRGLELLNGAPPMDGAEEDLVRRIREADWIAAR
jgi:hypothetical protein